MTQHSHMHLSCCIDNHSLIFYVINLEFLVSTLFQILDGLWDPFFCVLKLPLKLAQLHTQLWIEVVNLLAHAVAMSAHTQMTHLGRKLESDSRSHENESQPCCSQIRYASLTQPRSWSITEANYNGDHWSPHQLAASKSENYSHQDKPQWCKTMRKDMNSAEVGNRFDGRHGSGSKQTHSWYKIRVFDCRENGRKQEKTEN